MRSDFSLNNILRKKKKPSKLRVEPSSPQLLGFQSSRVSRRNKKAINNQVIIVSLINPDFEKKKKKIVVGRSRTTVNAIVRVSIYHRRYSDGTRDARILTHAPGPSMRSEPWLAYACGISRRPRAPG